MAGIAETARRRGRRTRLLAAFQSAKGSPASVFTGADAAVLWAKDFRIPVARRKSAPGPWMTESLGEDEASRFSLPENPAGTMRLNMTPQAIKLLLRSNFGPFAAGSFTLRTQIAATEFLTLAWVENHLPTATERLVRVPDVFIHTIRVRFGQEGVAVLEAEWQGRGPRIFDDLDALPGGLTLPTSPMKPSFKKFRAGASIVRDPAGINVELRYKTLDVELIQEPISAWTMTDNWDVAKQGKTKARIVAVSNWADETWAVADDSRAGTKRLHRVSVVSDGPAPETLTMDFHDADFEVEDAGKTGFDYEDFDGTGQAHVGTGGFVDITLA